MTFIDLLNAYHIMPQFSPSVLAQVEKMPKVVSKKEIEGRLDLTKEQIFTIDGDDAKDFDDAVSVKLLDNNNYLLGVHIADVTNYVKEGSAIDRAAFIRGTSVYLIDTVIPMLPFELSNELCSLKPDEIRLTISVFMEITPRGEVESYRICESFIKSCARMTYDNVTKILDGDEKLSTEYSHILSSLHHMKRLAGVLKKKRIKEGSIEFSSHESRITLDFQGKPISVEKYPITLSNSIIEEFMLICNKTIAKHFISKRLPCVYRVHEKPDLMRVERLSMVLPELGVEFRYSIDMQPKEFQKILTSVENLDCFDVVNYLVLRTMAKAEYSEKNLGHFGLAFNDYCHFTSPIRRYPDLAVHRILKESLKGEIEAKRFEELKEFVMGAAFSSSAAEINAYDAEMTWKSVKKTEYMAQKVGEEYDGVVTHIVGSGFFVELENTVEGFVAARTIEDDVYIISESGISLIGMRNKRMFTIGDRVKIRVVLADLENNRIDFELVEKKLERIYRRKSKKNIERVQLRKEDKKTLHKLKAENRVLRHEKMQLREKVDFERNVFENALIFELFGELKKQKNIKNNDKRFMEITLGDVATMIINPLCKEYINSLDVSSLQAAMKAATKRVEFFLDMISESFGFEIKNEFRQFAREYVRAALRHFSICIKIDEINRNKRENEYDSIARKIKKRIKGVELK